MTGLVRSKKFAEDLITRVVEGQQLIEQRVRLQEGLRVRKRPGKPDDNPMYPHDKEAPAIAWDRFACGWTWGDLWDDLRACYDERDNSEWLDPPTHPIQVTT